MRESDIEAGLGQWTEAAGGRASLINVSENHTYRIVSPRGAYVLRLHREGYQSPASIRSELAWVAALRDQLPVPRPIAGLDGQLLQVIGGRHAVLFAHEPGTEPAEDADLREVFRTLGRYAALLHSQVTSWSAPPGFERQRWSGPAILDPDGLWGDWRQAPGVGDVRSALNAVDASLRAALAAYGTGVDRFGLIHADMRLANLLVDGDHLTLIDFDDCGYCWFVYDLAASLSFIETRDDIEALIDAWLEGYTPVRTLEATHVAVIPSMILLRRMALLAWIGSHGETPLARKHAPSFAADTARLADRLLR